MKGNKKRIYSAGAPMKAGILYIVGQVVGQAVVLLSTPIFTRMMSTEDWGIVNTYAAWALIVNAVIGLNLHISVRNAFTDMPDSVDEFSSSVLTLSLFAFAGISLAVMLVVQFAGMDQYRLLAIFLVIHAYSQFVVNFYSAKLAMEFQYRMRTFLLIGPNVLHTALSLLFVAYLPWERYNSKVFGNMLGYLIFGVFSFAAVCMRGRTFIRLDYWKYGLAISIPAIGYSLADLVLMQCDRIMITQFDSATATAIYSTAHNVGSILWIISTGTGNAWMPWFNRQLDRGEKSKIQPYANYYLALFTVMALGLMMISPEILMLLTPQEYWSGKSYMAPFVIMSYLMFLYSFPMNLEFYHKKTKLIAWNTAITSVVNLILNYIFIKKCGAVAAAYTTMVSYALLFAMQWRGAQKLEPGLFKLKPFIVSTAVVCLGGVVYNYISDFWIIRYAFCVLMVAAVGIYVWKNKKTLLGLFAGND